MPTAKKKKSTKTAKKTTKCSSTRKKCTCSKKATLSSRDRAHVCLVTVLSIAAGILLCADAAMMIVS